MRIGDIIEWVGVNRVHRGRIAQSEKGDILVLQDNGCSFPLESLLGSKSVKVCQQRSTESSPSTT